MPDVDRGGLVQTVLQIELGFTEVLRLGREHAALQLDEFGDLVAMVALAFDHDLPKPLTLL